MIALLGLIKQGRIVTRVLQRRHAKKGKIESLLLDLKYGITKPSTAEYPHQVDEASNCP